MVVAPSPLQELAEAAEPAGRFHMDADLSLPSGWTLSVEITGYKGDPTWQGYVGVMKVREGGDEERWPSTPVDDLGAAFRHVVAQFPKAVLQPGSVKISMQKGTTSSVKLTPVAEQAWHEAYGLPIPSNEELAARRKRGKQARKDRDHRVVALLATDRAGVEEYNRLNLERRAALDYRRVDLAGRALDGVEFAGANLEGADLAGASLAGASFGSVLAPGRLKKAKLVAANLAGAKLQGCRCGDADFSRADLTGAEARYASFSRARFVDANLAGASFARADLRGADFTGASMAGVVLTRATFDETTRWPKKFRLPAGLVWKGKGADPSKAPTKAEKAKGRPADFPGFLDRLKQVADKSKLEKATDMLKADRFRLFARVEADHVVGVVKSQSDGSMVYSCRLGADGSYACCTQNLNLCGGLRGSPCKHLLVLIVGLTQAGEFDPGTAHDWAQSSRGQKPALDKDAMTETLLRFKGVEAGEVDWRPTETIPEDFYST